MHRTLGGSRSTERRYGEFLAGELELEDLLRPPSRLTRLLLPRVVDPKAASKRRRHYAIRLDRLRHVVPAPFASLPEGAVPFAFPIESDDPQALATALAAEGIETGRLWPTWHPTLPIADFPVARRFRERMLGLPVHQELTEADVLRIGDSARRALALSERVHDGEPIGS